MSNNHASIDLDVTGLGIIFYSKEGIPPISEEEDYLESSYTTVSDVLDHIYQGSLVSFCTGSPGAFTLNVVFSQPDEKLLEISDYRLRLWLNVKGGSVCFRDLYDLMEWDSECPDGQMIKVEDGYYQVTVCTSLPKSGVLGDGQTITLFFNRVNEPPKLKYNGVPLLCDY